MAEDSRRRVGASVLTDRRGERSVLDQLIGVVRAGGSRVLVVRGEPGVGKSALMDYLAGHAPGCRVARATGVQSEMELAFAGLHQLLAPVLDHLEGLPVPGAGEVVAAVCKLDYSRPGKPPVNWDDPQAKQDLVSDLVNDALAVLAGLCGPGAPERDAPAADALGLLALVAGQDVEPAEGSDGTDGRWRIARKVAPDRVISTAGRQARHTRKSKSKRRDGYRGHVAAEPETGLITDCEMTMAAGPGSADAENGVKMAARDRFYRDGDGDGPQAEAGTPADAGREQERGMGLEVYGDSVYGSGEARAAYREGGHDTVIKPGPLRPAVPGGFTVDDFTIDAGHGTVTCPAGVTRQMSPARTVTFGTVCASCPLRQRCTTARDGRSMTIHPQEDLLRAARARARTEEFRHAYPARSMIERVIAWTATQNGHRVRLRYTGTSKNDAWLHNRCAALNLRTLIKRGLTCRDGAWALG